MAGGGAGAGSPAAGWDPGLYFSDRARYERELKARYERDLKALYACRPRLLDGHSCSFALVDPTAARYAAWATEREGGWETVREGALCARTGQAPSARALELRVHLPAVASMLQINIRAATTTLSLSLEPDDEQRRQKMFDAKLPIPLPGACDPGAVRAHWAARARTLCVLLPLQSAPTGPLHTTLPPRLFASPPRDATPEGLCALHRSPLGSTVTCAADGFHVGGIFAAPVPALVDADARAAAVTPSLPPSKPAAINAVFSQEADGDDDFERRRVDDVATKCRRLDSVSAAACPPRLPRTRRGTRGGRSTTKGLLTQRPLCPLT